jgi:hypothetical protein
VIRYRILPELGLILIVPSGATNEDEIIVLSKRLRADPEFSHNYDALVDNTHLDQPPTGEELRQLAEPRSQAGGPDTKLAVIAPTDITYGTSRMHQMLAESRNPLQIQVFRDRSSALKWLSAEDARVETNLDDMGRQGSG